MGPRRGLRFSLGMAPGATLDRLGAAVFGQGEHIYNFRGMRGFNEKFEPLREPRYLACPGGRVVPRVLAYVGALVGGGLGGMVRR